ncbi:hypothetical protein SK854_05345 [Lentzea sp. BCCO 10_0061]|uniref:Uncharacterized protein n=1 Tax=Lentzea sokolovensis TaxID=3095429 RepID=A0ABU4UQT3_9PSEU|nr:hypothetical protein [Lentzea sp. BCCO 10_0061]MDX8141527.1 hypothetical protein [Lentzea sp. BCCO 10_0061]
MTRKRQSEKRVVFTEDTAHSLATDHGMFPVAVRPAALRLLWLGLGLVLVALLVLAVAIGRTL